MNKKAKIAGISAGAMAFFGAGVYFYNRLKSKADSTKSISVRLSEVKNLKHEGKGVTGNLAFDCDILISNPSTVNLSLGIRSIQILLQGSEIFNTKPDTKVVSIPAGSEKKITNIKFRLPYQNVLKVFGMGSFWDDLKKKAQNLFPADFLAKVEENLSIRILMRVNKIDMTFEQKFGEEETQELEDEKDIKGVLALSAGPRIVSDGSQFNHLIPNADNAKQTVMRDGDVRATVRQMAKNVKQYHGQLSKIAPMFKGRNRKETCAKIFNFSYLYLQYRNDRMGVEELRTPARSWFDGQVRHKQQGIKKSGIDCDDFSVWCASLLTCLGITDWKFRITKYDGKANWQHVYIVVPDGNEEIIIDPVLDKNNFEKKYSQKMDYASGLGGLEIQVLSGIEGQTAVEKLLQLDESESIEGLGNAGANEALLKRLILLRQVAKETPDVIKAQYPNPQVFIELLTNVINNWKKNPQGALDKAAEIEALLIENGAVNGIEFSHELEPEDVRDAILLKSPVASVDGVSRELEEEFGNSPYGIVETKSGIYALRSEVAGIAGAGGSKYIYIAESLDGRRKRRAKKKARKAKRKHRRATKGGFFKRVSTGMKKGIKTAVNIVKRVSPVNAAYRQLMLHKFRRNWGGVSTKLVIGYKSKTEASKLLANPSDYGKLVSEIKDIEKKYVKWGGKASSVRKAIEKGAKNRPAPMDGLDGLGAAPAIIAAVVGILKKIWSKIKTIKLKKADKTASALLKEEEKQSDNTQIRTASRRIKGKKDSSEEDSKPRQNETFGQKISKTYTENKTAFGIGAALLAVGGVVLALSKKDKPKNKNKKPSPKKQLSGDLNLK